MLETIIGALASSAITAAFIALDRTKAQNQLMREAVNSLKNSVEHISETIRNLEKNWEAKLERNYRRTTELNNKIDNLEKTLREQITMIEGKLIDSFSPKKSLEIEVPWKANMKEERE